MLPSVGTHVREVRKGEESRDPSVESFMELPTRALSAFVLVLGALGCGGSDTDTPNTPAVDSGSPTDTGRDGVVSDDSGAPDTSVVDSGGEESSPFDTGIDTPKEIGGSGVIPVCGSCTTDPECAPGEVCVDLGLGPKYRFCAWMKSAVPSGDCDNVRPYHTAETVTTASGSSVVACLARADCMAINNFKKPIPFPTPCGLGPAGGTWDRNGSYCVLTCVSDLDCPVGSSCKAVGFGTTEYVCL